MFMRGDIGPPLDAAIFADTGEEPDAVMRHLAWLQSLGGPPILVRTAGRLGDDLMRGENSTRQRFASIPAFTLRPDGNAGKIRRQCSAEYKIDVIARTIRRDVLGLAPGRTPPRGTVVNQYIGISLEESGRARRIVAAPRAKTFRVHFPLIEHFMTRANCLQYLADKVPHETPRSACTFCPFHSDHEWLRLKREDAAGWARAVEVDAALRVEGTIFNRALDQPMFVHRSCVPLDLVQFDTRADPRAAQLAINFSAECLGVCGV
jgi:hypothetical protein